MISKSMILAVAVVSATPVCAGTAISSAGGGSPTSATTSDHSVAGGTGHGGGRSGLPVSGSSTVGSSNHSGAGGAGHGGALSGRAAAAAASSMVDRQELSSRAEISHANAMHATTLVGGKHTTSQGMDSHYHGLHSPQSACAHTIVSFFDCIRPAKSPWEQQKTH
jgi:hypothetical protein